MKNKQGLGARVTSDTISISQSCLAASLMYVHAPSSHSILLSFPELLRNILRLDTGRTFALGSACAGSGRTRKKQQRNSLRGKKKKKSGQKQIFTLMTRSLQPQPADLRGIGRVLSLIQPRGKKGDLSARWPHFCWLVMQLD